MIGEATGVIAPIFENIPKVLTKRRQWVTWRLEERDGRLNQTAQKEEEQA
jgi:primase-polymerase (primpol)-like protein